MNKTDEELNLAEAMAKRYGVRMCDENGDTQGEELYCVGIDDIADIIREARAEQDHIADTGKMIAEPVKQEPVAWWELNEDIGAWFLAYTFNPKAKTRPLIFGDVAPVSAKREWVELTDDEIYDALAEVRFVRDNLLDGCRALIAALKEKNK